MVIAFLLSLYLSVWDVWDVWDINRVDSGAVNVVAIMPPSDPRFFSCQTAPIPDTIAHAPRPTREKRDGCRVP